MRLKEKVALITGSSRGIGAATALLFGQNGAKVAVNYVNKKEQAEAVVNQIKQNGGSAMAFQADVTQQDQTKKLIEQVEKELGPIDILVLNAGLRFKMAPFTRFTWEDFEYKLVGEMKAAFYPSQYVVPSMINRKSGNIIAISSGLSKRPGEGFICHSSSKAALNLFAQSLALELGSLGIKVNIVSPGLTLTDATAGLPEEQKKMIANFTPLKRNGLAEDVARAVLMMASEDSQFITGAYLPVDGGITFL